MEPDEPTASSWRERIALALLAGVSVAECRIAAALLIRPDLIGSRSLEAGSGLSRSTVLATVPHGESKLLQTLERGSSNFRDPEGMRVCVSDRHFSAHDERLSSLDTHRRTGLSSYNQHVSAIATTTRARETYLAMLDPHLDIWSNRDQNDLGPIRMGSTGWALAVVYGDATVPLHEVRALLGLSDRGTRAALARLAARGWLKTHRAGRQVVVEMRFGRLATEEFATTFRDGSRANRVSSRHEFENKRVAHRRTPLGLIAWLTARDRPDEPKDADPGWAALVATGTEEQIYAHLAAADKIMRRPPPAAPSEPIYNTSLFHFSDS